VSGGTEWPGVMLLMSTYALAKSIHTYRRKSELPSIILSAAKDLTPVTSGDEILRCAQDDKRKSSSSNLSRLPGPILRA
jgi:hypothetical protein